MPTFPVIMGLMDPLYNLFGWILTAMYTWLENYGLVIIVFTILINILLLPFGIKSQKGMLKQQSLQDEINEIKRLHPDDPQLQQQLQQELFKENGISLAGGCLPSFLRLILIIPVFRIFQQPLQYIGGVSAENIEKIGTYLKDNNLLSASAEKMIGRSDIPVISTLQDNASALGAVVEKGYLRLSELIDLNFLGINLGRIPSWRPGDIFGENSHIYLPLLILPALTIISMIIQMRLMTKISQTREIDKEEIQRAKRNPAKKDQMPTNQNAAGTMKSMNFFMIILMVWTVFTLPSAMGIYWVINTVMGIAQSLFIYKFYTKPFKEQLAMNKQSYNKRRSAQ